MFRGSAWLLLALCLVQPLSGATRIVDSVFLGDFDVENTSNVSFDVDFSAAKSVSGFGLMADWTAVVSDGSLNPWALDLRLTGTSPIGAGLIWDPIGGDVTVADYPLADYSPDRYSVPQPSGLYSIEFSTPGVPGPYVSGVRNATVYAMEEVLDVVTEYDGSVESGPLWDRPFFIEGISGLGPVVYDVLPFTVSESGGYSFESEVATRNNFNFLYRGGFDADLPLDNLLDYGLGNGFGANGTPQGTSLIEALLLAGETYYYVTSQFERTFPGQEFETTIVGPGNLLPFMPGDFDRDGDYACDDVDALVVAIVSAQHDAIYDLTDDGLVDTQDLSVWLAEAGNFENDSFAPYLPGDADLSGGVDGTDFVIWNQNKFSQTPAWCSGDFNADGNIDGGDFVLWNQNKFTSSDNAVPEPLTLNSLWLVAIFVSVHRRRKV